MATTVRYFSTATNGAGDGTTWNDRAALFSAGVWSTVITGFDFTSNSLECRIGPGTYTCSQQLASGLFTVLAPSTTNLLYLFGCDSSGNRLTPPDWDWTSDQAAWDNSGTPVIATSANIQTVSLVDAVIRLCSFTASGRSGAVVSTGVFDWVHATNSNANTASQVAVVGRASNCFFTCTGSSYDLVVSIGNAQGFHNCRVEGVTGSAGDRDGIVYTGTSNAARITKSTVTGVGGNGITSTSTNVAQSFSLHQCTIANIGGTGILAASTVGSASLHQIESCCITGCGAYGINAQSEGELVISNCRLRDNATANFNGLGNHLTDIDNYTTDSDDATEYNNSGSGDFRIKTGLAWSDRNIGVSQMAAAGTSEISYGFIS